MGHRQHSGVACREICRLLPFHVSGTLATRPCEGQPFPWHFMGQSSPRLRGCVRHWDMAVILNSRLMGAAEKTVISWLQTENSGGTADELT